MKIMQGDCLELMKNIPDKSIDMVLCDLPYGTTACKWDVIIPFEPLWEQYNRIIKDNACVALFGTQPFTSLLITSNLKMFKYDWIWDKVTAKGHLVAKYRPMQQSENISIFGKSKINYYPVMVPQKERKIKEYFRTEIMGGKCNENYERKSKFKYPKTILTYSNAVCKNNLHPTQKPIALLEYLIKTYTLENQLVLDNCMGSGSTGISCINLKRKFIGIEKDEKYYQIAKNRIIKHLKDSRK